MRTAAMRSARDVLNLTQLDVIWIGRARAVRDDQQAFGFLTCDFGKDACGEFGTVKNQEDDRC